MEAGREGRTRISIAGASAAIEALAVPLAAPYAHLDADGRQLRNRLRAYLRTSGYIDNLPFATKAKA